MTKDMAASIAGIEKRVSALEDDVSAIRTENATLRRDVTDIKMSISKMDVRQDERDKVRSKEIKDIQHTMDRLVFSVMEYTGADAEKARQKAEEVRQLKLSNLRLNRMEKLIAIVGIIVGAALSSQHVDDTLASLVLWLRGCL